MVFHVAVEIEAQPSIMKEHGGMFVGNISAAGMAKSSLDAGWVQLKGQRRNKCDHASWL